MGARREEKRIVRWDVDDDVGGDKEWEAGELEVCCLL